MDGPTVRNLLRHATTATLATIDAATGHPYASLVEVATMPDARPILLLSGLARHTRNLEADPRASLLVDQRHTSDNPLATERATLIGRAARTGDETTRRRYLARHPSAEAYAGFSDFGFWRFDIDCAHGIAGFGRIREVPGGDVVLPGHVAAQFAANEMAFVAKVNQLLAAGVATIGAAATDHALCIATGADPEGIDCRISSGVIRKTLDLQSEGLETCVEAIVCALARG